MVTNLRIKLATITLLALTLVAVSIPVMATVYQNGDDTVKDCAAAGEQDLCLPQDQPGVDENSPVACDEPASVDEPQCTDSGSVTGPVAEVQCAQDSGAYTCPAAENTCDTVKASTSPCAGNTQNATQICNGSKTCTANKTCNKTVNATACNLNKTACTNSTNKTCVDNRASNVICNGSTPVTCPETTECEAASED